MDKKIIGLLTLAVVAVVGGVIMFSSSDDSDSKTESATVVTSTDQAYVATEPQDTTVAEETSEAPASETEEDAAEEKPIPENVIQFDGTPIKIDMKNYEYSVNAISVKAGETLLLDLTSSEGQHNIYVRKFIAYSKVLSAGESQDNFSFTIPKSTEPGQYEFYSTIDDGKDKGMVGMIIVL